MNGKNGSFRWITPNISDQEVTALKQQLGISKIFAAILISRGIRSQNAAIEFLNPTLQNLHDPDLLNGMQVAVARIVKAIEKQEKIYLYGDYDVDGITATSLLYKCLKLLGANAHYYIPHRLTEGYGIHPEAVKHLHSQQAALIITLDCGIGGYDAVEVANSLNIDVIISDHHEMGEQIPRALAVINPKDPRGQYPFTGLTGVGVSFKLAWAICRHFSPGMGNKVRPELRQFLLEALSLVALGTIADVAPLGGENRIIARYGLRMLETLDHAGLRALKEVSNLTNIRPLSPEHVGFWLGPRLNAMGRLQHAIHCVELLTTTNYDRAILLARQLDQENQKRKVIQEKILGEARAQIIDKNLARNKVLVLSQDKWHPGVVGIVASALQEQYYRPVCMIALEDGLGKGSARSIPGFHLFQALQGCKEHLLYYGGHELAAGFKIRREQIPLLQEALNKIAENMLTPEQMQPVLEIAVVLELKQITWQLVAEIEQIAPFGEGNPEPLLASYDLEVLSIPPPNRCGSKREHLRFMVRQGDTVFKGIAFWKGELADKLAASGKCSLLFAVKKNTWGGETNLELDIKDIQIL